MRHTSLKHTSCVLSMLCLLFAIRTHSQFVERSADLNVILAGSYSYFGAGTSFYDFNKDGLDDLTFCSTDSGAQVFENAGGYFIERFYFASLSGELKHAVWVDFDNDGDQDFFVTRMNAKPYLMRNEGDFTFTDISSALPCPDDAPFSTCCSWGDYDNDSFLDVYVVNYYFDTGLVSWLFHNNGDGTFDEVATEMNVNNGINPGFQCLWIDYNLDGDLDLMVLNDKYHGNKLYDNDGTGSFTDIGEASGFNRIADNMGITASDFDHDGDFDFYITITEGNLLLRNDNGIFTDVGAEFHVDTHCTSWSGLFIDSDNRTWEDLYVLSTSVCNSTINYFYENDHGEDFIEHTDMFDESNELTAYSASKGDWNNDGLYDVIVSNGPSTSIRFWENQNEGANWIRLNLEGSVSNANAVGSIIRCYVGELCLLRALTCGDDFMSQDTQNILIGIGDSTHVDSLFIQYPSGWIDQYFDLSANQFYHFIEGETFVNTPEQIFVSMCPGESVMLYAGNGTSFVWNTNEFSSSIEVTTTGLYEVEMINSLGFTITKFFHVDEIQIPEIEVVVSEPDCYDQHTGSIELILPVEEILTVNWSDDAPGIYRDQLHSGNYSFEISWANNCTSSYEVLLDEPPPIQFTSLIDTICDATSVAAGYQITGGVGAYTLDWLDANPDSLFAGLHEVQIQDENLCTALFSFEISSFDSVVFNYNFEIPCYGFSTSLQYDVTSDGVTQIDFGELNPQEMFAGEYDISITDAHGCVSMHEMTVTSLEPLTFDYSYATPCYGENTSISFETSGGAGNYTLDFDSQNPSNLPAGNYQVTISDANNCTAIIPFEIIENDELQITSEIQHMSDVQNGNIQLNTNGGTPPYTFHWSDNSIENYLTITAPGEYACTITDSIGCTMEETFEIINLYVAEQNSSCIIFPNPVVDCLNIQLSTPANFIIYAATGDLIFDSIISSKTHQLDVTFLSPGIYFVEVNGVFYKVMK